MAGAAVSAAAGTAAAAAGELALLPVADHGAHDKRAQSDDNHGDKDGTDILREPTQHGNLSFLIQYML